MLNLFTIFVQQRLWTRGATLGRWNNSTLWDQNLGKFIGIVHNAGLPKKNSKKYKFPCLLFTFFIFLFNDALQADTFWPLTLDYGYNT